MRKVLAVFAILAIMAATAAVTYAATMDSIRLTTDDGENAKVEAFGQVWYKVIFADEETEWR